MQGEELVNAYNQTERVSISLFFVVLSLALARSLALPAPLARSFSRAGKRLQRWASTTCEVRVCCCRRSMQRERFCFDAASFLDSPLFPQPRLRNDKTKQKRNLPRSPRRPRLLLFLGRAPSDPGKNRAQQYREIKPILFELKRKKRLTTKKVKKKSLEKKKKKNSFSRRRAPSGTTGGRSSPPSPTF